MSTKMVERTPGQLCEELKIDKKEFAVVVDYFIKTVSTASGKAAVVLTAPVPGVDNFQKNKCLFILALIGAESLKEFINIKDVIG